jgi:DNA-binding NtrC family response regulator
MSQVKVLLIDDEVEFAAALSERLRLRNYDTKAVHTPDDALAIIQHYSPDIVLLDFKMPGMDGIEVLRIIRKMDPTIEVIMLTGQGDPGNLEEAMRIGIFEYLVKPIDINELVLKIEKAQKKRNPEQ